MIGLRKSEQGAQIMKKFVSLRPKAYVKDNDDENKKAKPRKRCVLKRNIKFKDFKNCQKASQLINKVSCLENKGINADSLKENHRKFVENSKSLLRKQLTFKSEKHDIFTEKINKTSLSSNDDKEISSIDAMETYEYRMSKDLIWKKEKSKPGNIIKQYKNV